MGQRRSVPTLFLALPSTLAKRLQEPDLALYVIGQTGKFVRSGAYHRIEDRWTVGSGLKNKSPLCTLVENRNDSFVGTGRSNIVEDQNDLFVGTGTSNKYIGHVLYMRESVAGREFNQDPDSTP